MPARRARRDHRNFIILEHNMPDHPKIVGLSDAAFRTFIEAICYCSRQETDGRIPTSAKRKLGGARPIGELVQAGLLVAVDGGWELHDYLDFQRSKAEIEEIRHARRAAGSRGGHARATLAKGKQAGGKDPANGKQVASALPALGDGKTDAESSPETETETEAERPRDPSSSQGPRRRGTRLPPDWQPTDQEVAWARRHGVPDDYARRETDKFIDYWTAASGQGAVKLDWVAAWRNWIRNAAERNPPPSQNGKEPYTAW